MTEKEVKVLKLASVITLKKIITRTIVTSQMSVAVVVMLPAKLIITIMMITMITMIVIKIIMITRKTPIVMKVLLIGTI